jgi:hypothetical protein
MYGTEWNFLSFVLSGIAFSYGLLMFAFAGRPIEQFFRNSRAMLARGSRVRAEKLNGVTVFSLSDS